MIGEVKMKSLSKLLSIAAFSAGSAFIGLSFPASAAAVGPVGVAKPAVSSPAEPACYRGSRVYGWSSYSPRVYGWRSYDEPRVYGWRGYGPRVYGWRGYGPRVYGWRGWGAWW